MYSIAVGSTNDFAKSDFWVIYTIALAGENSSAMRTAIASKSIVVGIQLLILFLGFAAKATVLAYLGN